MMFEVASPPLRALSTMRHLPATALASSPLRYGSLTMHKGSQVQILASSCSTSGTCWPSATPRPPLRTSSHTRPLVLDLLVPEKPGPAGPAQAQNFRCGHSARPLRLRSRIDCLRGRYNNRTPFSRGNRSSTDTAPLRGRDERLRVGPFGRIDVHAIAKEGRGRTVGRQRLVVLSLQRPYHAFADRTDRIRGQDRVPRTARSSRCPGSTGRASQDRDPASMKVCHHDPTAAGAIVPQARIRADEFLPRLPVKPSKSRSPEVGAKLPVHLGRLNSGTLRARMHVSSHY